VVAGNATYSVAREGDQTALMVACDGSSTGAGLLSDVSLALHVSFVNPHGYLPGIAYGDLPYFGTLFVIYALAMLAYGLAILLRRRWVLPLQLAIFGVMVAGSIEMATWFAVMQSKNASGVPTPCDVCPITSDYVAAVVLSVVKRSVSRGLLLAVALGFGVVTARMPRRTTYALAALCLTYVLFGALDAVEKSTTYDSLGPTMYELPVVLLDLLFFMGIYVGINRTRAELVRGGQAAAAKLSLYDRLLKVLLANVAVFILMQCIVLAIQFRVIPLPWKGVFLLLNFYDALYLAVLLAMAFIWMPGPAAFQYSVYSGLAANEDDAPAAGGASDAVGEAMEAGSSAAGGDAGGGGGGRGQRVVEMSRLGGSRGAPAAGSFAIVDEDSDDDANGAQTAATSSEARPAEGTSGAGGDGKAARVGQAV
jgi:hypothetical protein